MIVRLHSRAAHLQVSRKLICFLRAFAVFFMTRFIDNKRLTVKVFSLLKSGISSDKCPELRNNHILSDMGIMVQNSMMSESLGYG